MESTKKYVLKKPEVVYGFLGSKLELATSHYKYVEQILTSIKFSAKSSTYDFLGNILGDGLLFSANEKWFNRRRIITPSFHFKILEQFFEVFLRQNRILLSKLETRANGQPLDIFPLISLSVLKSLCGKTLSYIILDIFIFKLKFYLYSYQRLQWDVKLKMKIMHI